MHTSLSGKLQRYMKRGTLDHAVLSSVRIDPEKTVGRKEITQVEKSSLLYCQGKRQNEMKFDLIKFLVSLAFVIFVFANKEIPRKQIEIEHENSM